MLHQQQQAHLAQNVHQAVSRAQQQVVVLAGLLPTANS